MYFAVAYINDIIILNPTCCVWWVSGSCAVRAASPGVLLFIPTRNPTYGEQRTLHDRTHVLLYVRVAALLYTVGGSVDGSVGRVLYVLLLLLCNCLQVLLFTMHRVSRCVGGYS